MRFLYSIAIVLLSVNIFADEDTYKEAMRSYNAKEFAKAYPAFRELSQESPQSAELNFYLGRSALEIKEYDEALAAFDRVLILNPSHTRTHMELARLYFETRKFELALAELDTVLKENLPRNIREVALAFKTRIDEQIKRHKFGGAFIVGAGYDSNANNDIGRKEFIIPSFNIPIMGNEKASDSNIFSTLVLNHIWDFGDRGGWSLENSFVAYGKINKERSSNNLALFSFNISPTWSGEGYKASFPLTYDRIYLDSKGYLHNISLGTDITYMIDATSALEGRYTHKTGYYDEDDALDSKSDSFAISYKKAFSQNTILFSAYLNYSDTSAIESGRTDVKSDAISYGAEVAKKFQNGIRTSVNYRNISTDYDLTDALFGTKRSDEREEFGMGLRYSISSDTIINTVVTYADNRSNHEPYNYDKVTAIANLILSF